MFDPFDHEDTDLTEAISRAYKDLGNYEADSDEYRSIVNQLTALHKMQNANAHLNLQAQREFAEHKLASDQQARTEEQERRPFYMRVDPNTVLTVAGNLLVAVVVVKYEQRNVIATKVTSFMRKI